MGATHNDRKFRGFEPRWPSQVFALLLAFQSFVLPSLAQAAAERLPTSSNTSTSTSTGTATFTAPPPATANQSGLQQNTGNSNKLASILSTGLGVLSMAAGGLAVAGGAAQLSCCSSGCPPGSGFRALSSFLGLGQAANNATPGVANAAGTGSSSATPAAAAAPAGAEGAGAGCYVDGAFSLAAGGLMLLNGIAALAAGKEAGKNANTAFGNAGGMNSFGDLSGIDTSKKVAGEKTNSNLNGGLDNGNQMKLDPALLRTGTANDIMGQFENRFGLERDQFAENVIGGRDPRELLATAPKNPISVGNLNKAITSAQSLSSEDKARASSALLAAAQKEMSDKLGAGTLADADAGARGPAGKNGSKANQDEELLQLGGAPPVAADTNKLDDLSPEIKEALLAKQAADVKSSAATMNLFQRVHIKYLDKTKMILGYDPKSGWKGVGNENGF